MEDINKEVPRPKQCPYCKKKDRKVRERIDGKVYVSHINAMNLGGELDDYWRCQYCYRVVWRFTVTIL